MTLPVLDRVTEAGARWLARRTTRRSFLGTAGKTVLVAAGGSAVSLAFAQQAEARVCGQSGVSPRCPTFDCVPPDFWGWCWYAGNASCCADGGLKKICDCCRTKYPNVQGYCPDGSSVFCVVESCLEDPRVQRVPLDRWISATVAETSAERTAARIAAGAAPTVVMTSADDPLLAAVALPVAAELGVPLLLVPGASVPAAVERELTRLGTTRIVMVGGGMSAAVVGTLATGRALDRMADTVAGIAAVSVEIAKWVVNRTGRKECVALGAGAASAALAGVVGGLAGNRRMPLLVSADAVTALRSAVGADTTVTWIGADSGAPATPGASDRVVTDADPSALSRKVAQIALDAEPAAQFRMAVSLAGAGPFSAAFLAPGTLAVLTGGPEIDPALRDWIIGVAARFSGAETSFAPSATLSAAGTYQLQSALNGFMANVLTGVSGQGLPVVAQPMAEREIGKARVRPPWPGRQAPPVVSRIAKGP